MADKEGLLRLRTVSGMDAAEMAKLRQRAQLADRFFEVLISRRHGSAEGLTAAVSTAHFCFLPASEWHLLRTRDALDAERLDVVRG